MESTSKMAQIAQLNLAANKQGAITIERLKPQPKVSKRDSSYSMNYTTLNLQLISIKKMDMVLHSVQRRLSKQKEQYVFAEFMRNYHSAFENRPEFMEDGQVNIIDKGKVNKKVLSGAFYGDAKNTKIIKSDRNRQHLVSNELVAVKDLTKELKTCINVFKKTLLDVGERREIARSPVKNRQLTYKEGNPKFSKHEPVSVFNRQRKQLIQSGHHLQNFRHENPRQLNDFSVKIPRDCLKYKPIIANRIVSPCLQNGAEVVPAEGVTHTGNTIIAEKFDALAMWQRLTEIEKIEETVNKNLQIINLNKELKAIESKEQSKNTSKAPMLSELTSVTTSKGQVEKKDATHTTQLVDSIHVSNNTSQFGPKNAPVTSNYDLSPSSDVVEIIKKLSNTLVDELVKEVSNEIADLPDAFLTELLEREFDSGLLLR